MKLAKSHKIILIITAALLSVMIAVCSLNLFLGKSATVGSPSSGNYFSGATSQLTENGALFTVDSEQKPVTIKNLAIDNMEIKLGEVKDISKFELTLTYASFYVNGNKKIVDQKTTFETTIENKFELTPSSNDAITINVEKNANDVKVNGSAKVNADFTNAETTDDVDYRIRKVDKAVAEKIELKAILADGKTSGSFVIESIDQDTKDVDGKYKQSLKLDADKNLTAALPVIGLSADMFVRDADGVYTMNAYANEDYSLSYTVYSVLGNVKASDIYPTVDGAAKISIPKNYKNENKDSLHIMSGVDRTETFKLTYMDGETPVDCATYTVNVWEKLTKDDVRNDGKNDDDVNNAPEYLLEEISPNVFQVKDQLALEAFKYALKQEYTSEDGENVPLGSEVEIPSFEDLVVDDRTPYNKLTKKLYYGSSEESTSSTLKITLTNVGDYYFYVTFTDMEEKAMDSEELFVEYDEDYNVTYGKYGSSKSQIDENEQNQRYIFYFSILEDKEIIIEEPASQGKGYKGTKYTASKFEIKASNYEVVYKLEYAEDKDATEWVEIKQVKDVDEEYDENGYDYERLEKINYNGQYTFTPDVKGAYRITCSVTSKLAVSKNATASTIIEVTEESKIVTPSSNWFADNVWSVVFLSVGTLCLIGIIVLLFVKPKEKTGDEE